VESVVGQGTTFTLYLPLADPETEERLATGIAVRAAGAGETILLVEDNEAARDAMQQGLEALEYQVITAPDGKVALGLLRQAATEIDLVLSDMVMPDMGGLELYRIVQAEEIPVKMILMTGYPLEEEGRRLLKQGNVTWLQKPVSLERLASALQEILNSR
jgi:CheY-like chemotaxis protein